MVPGKLGVKPITDAEIERRFTYHRPSSWKIDAHDDVREDFKAFARALNERIPAGREASTMLTKLEEAANWAHAAIARSPLRLMPDGTACWCVSDEEPHEGWIHSLTCLQMREDLPGAPRTP